MTQVRDSQRVQRAGAAPVDASQDAAGVAEAPAVPSALKGLDVIEVRKALADPMTAEERARIFATPLGSPGLVPVLDAARRGLPQLAAVYAGLGAALNVQTSAGLQAVHIALDNGQPETARTFLGTAKLREGLIDAKRVSLASVREKLAAIPKDATDADLDRVALSLSAGNASLLNKADQLSLYCAHLRDADDVPGIYKAEGWNPEWALEMRIRSLVGMFAAHGAEDAGLREALTREIAVTTEALHVERRVYIITQKADGPLMQSALENEAEVILRKIDLALADGNSELTHQLIPVNTFTHAMYLTLEPCFVGTQKHYLLRFDNAGYLNGTHTQKGSQVYPIRDAVLATPEMRALLKNLIVDMMAQRCKSAGSVEAVYAALNRWVAGVVAELGPDSLDDPRRFEEPYLAQAVGNCLFANLQPSTTRRLGDHAEAFLDFEYADARRRRQVANSEELFDAAIERAQRKARDKRAALDKAAGT